MRQLFTYAWLFWPVRRGFTGIIDREYYFSQKFKYFWLNFIYLTIFTP